MAIKFQYNKTSLGELNKQLKIRKNALPTIKSKESALRSEVKRAKDSAQAYRKELAALKAEYDYMVQLWGEFDCDLIRITDVELSTQKIAGVCIPILNDIVYQEKAYDLFSAPVWYAEGTPEKIGWCFFVKNAARVFGRHFCGIWVWLSRCR